MTPTRCVVGHTALHARKGHATSQFSIVVSRFAMQVATNIQQNETYVLYQCGTPPPAASQFSVPVKFFEIPLTSVSVPDTTSAAFMVWGEVKDGRPGDRDIKCTIITATCLCRKHSTYWTGWHMPQLSQIILVFRVSAYVSRTLLHSYCVS